MSPLWILFIAVAIVSAIIQARLNGKFEEYSHIPTNGGLTGAEVAQKMLRDHGITGVKVTCIQGTLTDHYDPRTNTVNLSEAVFGKRSIAAAAVAAHECGHVIQHAQAYGPLQLRSTLVPVVSFSSRLAPWLILGGMLFLHLTPALLWLGIILFAASTAFSVVTLPVEIDASRRAIAWLGNTGITDAETAPMAKDALKWAAYTYVIAAVSSIATLLYYIGFARRN